jgi:outer membrane immunogenic protein
MEPMKQTLFVGVAFVALCITSAQAADLRVNKAPPPPPPVFSWTGFYLGSHTGVAVGTTTTRNTDSTTVTPYDGFDAGVPLSYDLNSVAVFGGGQIGYNWQLDKIVLGLEADGGYLGARASQQPSPGNLVEVKYGWYGTFTGRAGFAYDRLMTYVKGGAAVAQIRNTASAAPGGVITTNDFSEVTGTKWGWVIGSGFEYAILPNWNVKSEYLYMDFGTRNSTNIDGDIFEHRNRIQTWKVGLNYRFGGSPMQGY